MTRHPTFRVNHDSSQHGPGSVSVCGLGPDLVGFLAGTARRDNLLKSIFRVSVVQELPPEVGSLPDVAGRYDILQNEVRFAPLFPFESDVKYRVSFDPQPVAPSTGDAPFSVEFLIPSDRETCAPTSVTHIYPSCELLPENLLRFYVCFSNPMQRGRALGKISLLDSEGQPVADSLYRPPVELWDRTMRHLTVLLDPGRLKRRVGPNVELGPPLKAGQKYTLEIGSGVIDLYGRPLREPFRKDFLVENPVREQIAVESWKILPPVTHRRGALVLKFARPLDWALLLQMITIETAGGSAIAGRVAVDECETRWSFTPASPWAAGAYHIRVASSLEDVCGNNVSGAFDRPLRIDPLQRTEMNCSPLTFKLT
jgi:hypothetical protein